MLWDPFAPRHENVTSLPNPPTETPVPPDETPNLQSRPAWRQNLARSFPHWDTNLNSHQIRRSPRALEQNELVDLFYQVEEILGGARSAGTWSDLASVVNNFEAWDAKMMQSHRMFELQPLDMRMILWITYKRQEGGVQGSSALEYYRKLHQVYRLITGGESPIMKEFGAALARQPGAQPEGARAITETEIQKVIRETRNEIEKLQASVQWLTASRSDDLHRLDWEDVTIEGETVTLHWNKGTKGGTQKRVDMFPVAAVPRIKEHLRLKNGRRPFPLDAERMTAMLRRILGHAERLSSHSIKKGALTHLLRQGAPLSQVQFKAKHQTLENLQTYVGPVVWAEAHHALESSQLLATTLTNPAV